MYEIKNIDPVSLGRSLAAVGGSIFLASVACFVVLMMGFGEIDAGDLFDEEVLMFLGGGLAISTAGSFIGGLVGAIAYNYISSGFGGIKLDINYQNGDSEPLQDNKQNGSNVPQEVKADYDDKNANS